MPPVCSRPRNWNTRPKLSRTAARAKDRKARPEEAYAARTIDPKAAQEAKRVIDAKAAETAPAPEGEAADSAATVAATAVDVDVTGSTGKPVSVVGPKLPKSDRPKQP